VECPLPVGCMLSTVEERVLCFRLFIRCDGGQASRVRNLSTEAGTFIIDAVPEFCGTFDDIGCGVHVVGGADEVCPQLGPAFGDGEDAGVRVVVGCGQRGRVLFGGGVGHVPCFVLCVEDKTLHHG